MNRLSEMLGVQQCHFEARCTDLIPWLFVARANDGRLPVLPSARIVLRKGEVAHLETNAQLLKEQVIREWRGRSSGVSFRVAKGVRYHVGASRGRSVIVGTQLATDDVGTLTVTSLRAVFVRVRKNIEMPFTKLLNLNVFTDGVQFHLFQSQKTRRCSGSIQT